MGRARSPAQQTNNYLNNQNPNQRAQDAQTPSRAVESESAGALIDAAFSQGPCQSLTQVPMVQKVQKVQRVQSAASALRPR